MSKKKMPSLRQAFDAAVPKEDETPEDTTPSTPEETQSPAERKYPGPNGKSVAGDYPVQMSFMTTAKDRYFFRLGLRKRGLTLSQFFRDQVERVAEPEEAAAQVD